MGKVIPWTEEELRVLEEGYRNREGLQEIADKLPGRSKGAVFTKAQKSGFTVKYTKNEKFNKPKEYWTEEEIKIVEDGYKNDIPLSDIQKQLPNRTIGGIIDLAIRKGYSNIYIKKNNANYKAIYQDYDWCYERYINRGMSHDEMAEEAGCKKRVLVKWCTDIHGLHNRSFRKLKHLSDLQRRLIIAGLLGDGHVPKDNNQPFYIESHSRGEFDYIFWKYSILKDICNYPPSFYSGKPTNFGTDKYYECEDYYRLTTRYVDELIELRDIPRIDKIKNMDEFQLACHTLDDGNRDNLWCICLAEYTQEEIETYIDIVFDKFKLRLKQGKDTRYCYYDAISSKRLDEIILKNIPNNLDIIKKKILENIAIKDLGNYRYLLSGEERIGLASFCRENHLNYENAKDVFDNFNSDFNEVNLNDFLKAV